MFFFVFVFYLCSIIIINDTYSPVKKGHVIVERAVGVGTSIEHLFDLMGER